MKKFYVYIHTCPNGKKYVGITIRKPEYRWRKGEGYKSNKHFYSAIQKYKWDNIEHQVFEVDTKEEMFFLEKYFIAYYQTNNPDFGYNNSIGGEKSSEGCHFRCSEDKKIKISNSLKGHFGWTSGRHHSEETKRKISEAHKKKHLSEETKRKIRESLKGFHHSEETKAKMKGRIPWNKGLKKELV